ncbi:hypothetical protein EAG75_09485 [Pseudomonas protegens]|nr:hypothetical protein [Pseudomonas sp. JV245A]RLO24193.1 hypothetical protein EAG75_09485 [Pseudomonas protegens]
MPSTPNNCRCSSPPPPPEPHPPRRSRLAGEEACKPCSAFEDAFAGKPAPTAAVRPVRAVSSRGQWRSAGPGRG